MGVATAAHLAVLGLAINGDHRSGGPDRTLAFFVIEGLAATVGLGAVFNFGVRHPRGYPQSSAPLTKLSGISGQVSALSSSSRRSRTAPVGWTGPSRVTPDEGAC